MAITHDGPPIPNPEGLFFGYLSDLGIDPKSPDGEFLRISTYLAQQQLKSEHPSTYQERAFVRAINYLVLGLDPEGQPLSGDKPTTTTGEYYTCFVKHPFIRILDRFRGNNITRHEPRADGSAIAVEFYSGSFVNVSLEEHENGTRVRVVRTILTPTGTTDQSVWFGDRPNELFYAREATRYELLPAPAHGD